jgi:hypothetical protein
VKRPSASNAEAFVRCTASHVLPQHESYQSYTEAGTDGHKLLCDYYNRVPGAFERLEGSLRGLQSQLDELFGDIESITAEDAYVVDLEKRTSIYLGRNIDRQYEKALGRKLRDFEICTSLDVRGRSFVGQRAWIRDFKFGITSSWWQLYIQAMAVLWLPTPADQEGEVDAGFVFIEDRDDCITLTVDEATLYLVDLDMHADTMMEAFRYAERIEAELEQGLTAHATLKTVEGKWCTYCGAFPHCPSKWKLAKSMLSLDIVDNIAALTTEQCGDAWLKLAEIKKNIIDKTEKALKERMRAEKGFPLPDGKILKVMPMPARLGFDKDGAIALLQRLGASQEEIVSLIKRGEAYDQVRKVNRK